MSKFFRYFCFFLVGTLYTFLCGGWVYAVSLEGHEVKGSSYKDRYGISLPDESAGVSNESSDTKTDPGENPVLNQSGTSTDKLTDPTDKKKVEKQESDIKDVLGQDRDSLPAKNKKVDAGVASEKQAETLLAFGSVEEKKFSNYKELKIHLIELISSATKRIYISTDLFADPDLASSLFVAKFKKIDVIVLLDPQQSSNYRSKVSFFLDNGIPVYSRAKSFHTKYKTLFIIDQGMYTYKYSLSSDTHDSYMLYEFLNFNLTSIVEEFTVFKDSSTNPQSLKRPRLPNVKVSSGSSAAKTYNKSAKGVSSRNEGVTNIEESVYEYDRYPQQRVAPSGVDTKLPKELKSTKR